MAEPQVDDSSSCVPVTEPVEPTEVVSDSSSVISDTFSEASTLVEPVPESPVDTESQTSVDSTDIQKHPEAAPKPEKSYAVIPADMIAQAEKAQMLLISMHLVSLKRILKAGYLYHRLKKWIEKSTSHELPSGSLEAEEKGRLEELKALRNEKTRQISKAFGREEWASMKEDHEFYKYIRKNHGKFLSAIIGQIDWEEWIEMCRIREDYWRYRAFELVEGEWKKKGFWSNENKFWDAAQTHMEKYREKYESWDAKQQCRFSLLDLSKWAIQEVQLAKDNVLDKLEDKILISPWFLGEKGPKAWCEKVIRVELGLFRSNAEEWLARKSSQQVSDEQQKNVRSRGPKTELNPLYAWEDPKYQLKHPYCSPSLSKKQIEEQDSNTNDSIPEASPVSPPGDPQKADSVKSTHQSKVKRQPERSKKEEKKSGGHLPKAEQPSGEVGKRDEILGKPKSSTGKGKRGK
ncbi:hypothetical protein BJ508DRAFT_311978 [Ascobolus immersus RN42]|uniref:Uncharacterized protein n=1 Tax=Ascobolus immersus RN42 TaxID=1160509 RepID=A0A3N4HR70_ASCIM|nr:hypothetical protein BJ508DRAFT_311978 [Ascobolus immersus RN42]